MNTRLMIAGTLSAIALSGCGIIPGLGGEDYGREQARGEQSVRFGIVDSVREVKIEGTRSGVGAVTGGVAGGAAGSQIGEGRGRVVGAVIGAIAGGVGGAAVEQAATKQKGVEVTVKLDTGKYIAITQAADEKFMPGDRVRILSGNGTTRVTRQN
jgi:outer membrane lipoprotein SlyB